MPPNKGGNAKKEAGRAKKADNEVSDGHREVSMIVRRQWVEGGDAGDCVIWLWSWRWGREMRGANARARDGAAT